MQHELSRLSLAATLPATAMAHVHRAWRPHTISAWCEAGRGLAVQSAYPASPTGYRFLGIGDLASLTVAFYFQQLMCVPRGARPHACTAAPPPFAVQLRAAAAHCIWSWSWGAKVAALWRGLKCARQMSTELLRRLDWGQARRRRSEGPSERGALGRAGCRTCW